ncbi:MAG: hypothetical protein DMF70_11430 [Acidobacteria bacterium]|nr:MAG: hypothetical protein DMF70_11430 [Acidobacteriota bacterium]
MPKVQIEPRDFGSIPRWREIIKTLPEAVRLCQEHGEQVDIKLGEAILPDQGSGVPFSEAYWEGCCVEAINRVREGVLQTLELIDRAKKTYRDELARKLEPEHRGEIVAIELGTNDYFVGDDEVDAADKARAAGHAGALFFLRVGSPHAHRLMTPRQ